MPREWTELSAIEKAFVERLEALRTIAIDPWYSRGNSVKAAFTLRKMLLLATQVREAADELERLCEEAKTRANPKGVDYHVLGDEN